MRILLPYFVAILLVGYAFPSTVNRTLSIDETQKLIAGEPAPYFGEAVSVSGDTAVIGAGAVTVGQNPLQGAAYVYRRTEGTWQFQQRLVWDQGGPSDKFGTSVVVRGDTIMVGAPHARLSGGPAQGVVVAFRRAGSGWQQWQVLSAADGAADDDFGRFLAISGETAMIGSYRDQVGANIGQGSVYVFARTPNGWAQTQKLTAPDGAANDAFGNVNLSGETAVVGSFRADIGSIQDQGAAYVFTKNGQTWAFAQKLTASDGAVSDWFGGTVAIYGGTIAVGSGNADPDASDAGYVFVRESGAWIERQKITRPNDIPSEGFWIKCVRSSTIVAGSTRSTVGPGYARGMAYIFSSENGVWNSQQRLEASDGTNGDGFVSGAEIFRDTIMIGAPFADSPPGEGAAYVFERTISPIPAASISGRVVSGVGRGAYPTRVSIEDAYGTIRYANTNPFGYYRFRDIEAGSEYTLMVSSKSGSYSSRTVVVEADVSDLEFTALP